MTTNWDPCGLRIRELVDLAQLSDLPPGAYVSVPAAVLREALERLVRLTGDSAALGMAVLAVEDLHGGEIGGVCDIDGQPRPCRTVVEMYAAQGMGPDPDPDPESTPPPPMTP